MKKSVRVGNASGYWGDDLAALMQQLSGGPIDYVTLDFLAEITMSILQKQRARDSRLGYAADFVDQIREALPLLKTTGIRVISNAGGINPAGCAEKIAAIARESVGALSIAVVSGDDLMGRLDDLRSRGISLQNMETGEDFSLIHSRVESANAYLGAAPVVQALREGAQLVVTGRVTDTGITAAVPLYEFDWSLSDWDRIASAVVAGHIIECGTQASGGNLTDWREVPGFENLGYPIAEFFPDGSFQITKHENAGGLVNVKTVTEQLVYEMGDPRRYITPDAIADFTSIVLKDLGDNRVRISGVRGSPPTDNLKVSISYQNGFKAHGTLLVSRPEAADKARALAEMFWKRLGLAFEETSVELVGHNAAHRHLVPAADPPEILLRLGVRDSDRDKVEEFSKKFTSLILSGPSGVAIVGSRPRTQEVVAYWPCLIPVQEVSAEVSILEGAKKFVVSSIIPEQAPTPDRELQAPGEPTTSVSGKDKKKRRRVVLKEICYARSGDKGDMANIGVVARTPAIYEWMVEELTAQKVKEFFGEICGGRVERFEVPNLWALNFLLHESLGGGGTVSLRIDPQGKTLASALLLMQVDVPEGLFEES
ncbi:MAG: DUF1446 domain-containing protein [Acidobacteria bacterium]|nr:DUF1446 domain-containing protein [Acidobacteriota bacterium]